MRVDTYLDNMAGQAARREAQQQAHIRSLEDQLEDLDRRAALVEEMEAEFATKRAAKILSAPNVP